MIFGVNRFKALSEAGVQCGITLVELLIVLVIIAVVTAVAVPMYQDHTRSARRAAAQSDLVEIASRLEQFYLNNRTYVASIGGDLKLATASEGGHYGYEFSSDTTAIYYEVEANALTNSQNKDSCPNLTVNSDGIRGPSGCW